MQYTEPINRRARNGQHANGQHVNGAQRSGTPANGAPASGPDTMVVGSVARNGEVSHTERVQRGTPMLPEVPELPQLVPVEPEFWFGPPLSEADLPPADGWAEVESPAWASRPAEPGESRKPDPEPSVWFPASAARSAEIGYPVEQGEAARPGGETHEHRPNESQSADDAYRADERAQADESNAEVPNADDRADDEPHGGRKIDREVLDTYTRLGITPVQHQRGPEAMVVEPLSAPELSPEPRASAAPARPPAADDTDVTLQPIKGDDPPAARSKPLDLDQKTTEVAPVAAPELLPDAGEADAPARRLTEPIKRERIPLGDAEVTDLIPRVRAPAPDRPAAVPPPGPVDQSDPRAEPRPESHRRADRADGDDVVDGDDQERPKRGKHRRPPRRQPLWKEILVLVGVALLLTFLIQHFIGRVYSIPSGSMEQTLHGCPGCTGDRVFVDKIIYTFRDPAPGDVVVFQGPNTWTENDVKTEEQGNAVTRGLRYVGSFIGIAPPDERDFVKRVIAVGGQTVECCDEQNRVLVNGKPLDEPYVYWENGGPDERQKFSRVTVPEGTLWVMGDNRGNSSDSRFQGGGGVRGVVPLGKVIGKARYIVLPPSRWRGVGDHNPQESSDISAAGWHQGIPAGIGLAAAWPVLWLSRRVKQVLTPRKAE